MSLSADHYLRRLHSGSNRERLEAARFFAEQASPAHEQQLREALANEGVLWIKAALRRAIARLAPNDETIRVPSIDRDDLPAGFAAQVHAEALQTTTSQLIHEIEPVLGTLRLAAETEVPNFDGSATRTSLDRLDSLLAALSRLRHAATAPKIDECPLDEIIQGCIQSTTIPEGIKVLKSGPQPCVVDCDASLVSLACTNGLRNAIEATVAVGGDLSRLPITIAWGTTNTDCWISILDTGIGFKGNLQRAFEMGSTTKAGHLGMGLATAKQAVGSMGGQVLLAPNERGVRFEMRWPKPTS